MAEPVAALGRAVPQTMMDHTSVWLLVAAGLVGFALLGTGVALVVPLVFAAAGRVGPHPARSIAGVAGIAYGSGLVAPGVIGGIAAISSLEASFCLVAALVAVMVPAAVVLREG